MGSSYMSRLSLYIDEYAYRVLIKYKMRRCNKILLTDCYFFDI